MAMLVDPRAVERDNQNSLRKFPFSDAASCTNGACVIVPGAIVDAQLYIPGREPGRVWLSSVGTDGKLYFADASGVFAETATPATPDTAVPVVFTGDGGPCPGGVVVFGKEADVSALRSCGGQSFTSHQTELAPAAVSWPGLPGVCGFRLDDGHVVYGAVKMRGENGCVVATYTKDGMSRLRISAVGRTVETEEATGFVTKVVTTSDNRHFVINDKDPWPPQVVELLATGAALTLDDGTLVVADRDDLCAQVRKTLGTKPSSRAAGGMDCVCGNTSTRTYTITLKNPDGSATIGELIGVVQGTMVNTLQSPLIPTSAGQHFIGYFDTKTTGGWRYFRADGTVTGPFMAAANVTLYARFVPASSEKEVTFNGYGTLHISAPDGPTYANPIRITGNPSPVPTVKEVSEDALQKGGADTLADIVLHPSVPAGEVHIGLRGLGKASML